MAKVKEKATGNGAIVKNLLTVDVEDYFHVESFADVVSRDMWGRMECRIETSTRRTLELLGSASVRATFFVLGWAAERHPHLVGEIAAAGHEVASHGFDHEMVSRLSPEGFRNDLRRSKGILENLTKRRVRGYRAPTFSLGAGTRWAWDILAEEGFEYDSSSFPVHHDRYGDPKARRYVHEVEASGGSGRLLEFPLTTWRVLGVNIPAAGGGYLRLFPLAAIRAAIRQSNRGGFPAVIYFHPWELDPEQPKVQASRLSRFRHYVNLSRTESKLNLLLGSTDFGPVEDYVDEWRKEHAGLAEAAEAGGKPRVAGCALPAAIGEKQG